MQEIYRRKFRWLVAIPTFMVYKSKLNNVFMSIVTIGLMKCPGCKKYFKSEVSFFVDVDANGNSDVKIPDFKTCPHCNFEIANWSEHVAYDPAKIDKLNQLTRKQAEKIMEIAESG